MAKLFAMLNVDEDLLKTKIIFNTQLTLDIILIKRLEHLKELVYKKTK